MSKQNKLCDEIQNQAERDEIEASWQSKNNLASIHEKIRNLQEMGLPNYEPHDWDGPCRAYNAYQLPEQYLSQSSIDRAEFEIEIPDKKVRELQFKHEIEGDVLISGPYRKLGIDNKPTKGDWYEQGGQFFHESLATFEQAVIIRNLCPCDPQAIADAEIENMLNFTDVNSGDPEFVELVKTRDRLWQELFDEVRDRSRFESPAGIEAKVSEPCGLAEKEEALKLGFLLAKRFGWFLSRKSAFYHQEADDLVGDLLLDLVEKWSGFNEDRGNGEAFVTMLLKKKMSRMMRDNAVTAKNLACECDVEIEAMTAEPVYVPDLIVDLGNFVRSAARPSILLAMNLGFYTIAEIQRRDPKRGKDAFYRDRERLRAEMTDFGLNKYLRMPRGAEDVKMSRGS